MATSPVDICNSALLKLGVEAIVNLTDQNPRAILCNLMYTKMRDKLLRSHPWKFALVRVALVIDPVAPVFGYSARFPLPADCLRIVETDSYLDWVVESGYILSNDTGLNIRYIQAITDVTKFEPIFAEALAWALANEMAYAFTTSNTLKDQIAKEYRTELAAARSFDAQQQTPRVVQSGDWLNSRY